MSDVALIARCPTHGLHGERSRCHVCGGPVAQVPMVPAERLRDAKRALRRIAGLPQERLLHDARGIAAAALGEGRG